MFRNNRSEDVVPSKVNVKVYDYKKELEDLGKIKEDLVLEIKNKKESASYYNDIDKKVEEAEKELKGLNSKVKELKTADSLLTVSNEKLVLAKKELKEVNALSQGIQRGNVKLNEQRKTITKMLEDKKTELESDISSLTKDKINVQTELDNLKTEHEESIADYNKDINKGKKEAEDLDKIVNDQREVLGALNIKIIDSQKKLTDISSRNIRQEEASNKLVAENEKQAELVLEKAKEKAEKIIKDVIDREGTLSERESWLVEKEQTLKDTKLELEKFYGRKINNVNI